MDQPKLTDIAAYLDDPGNAAFLCEIQVTGTSVVDWQRVLDLFRGRPDWKVEYLENSERVAIPDRVEVIFHQHQQATTLLRITPNELAIHAHFFTPTAVEFDISAREIDTQSRLDELLRFAQAVGHATSRAVMIYPEAAQDAPFLIYDPATEVWVRR